MRQAQNFGVDSVQTILKDKAARFFSCTKHFCPIGPHFEEGVAKFQEMK
jgi:hypothetical protein